MKGIDMTRGAILRQLMVFAAPLVLGNLFQQTFNAIDAVIVGNYISTNALGAVGASGPIINILISFFMGASGGAGVLISQHFGAQNAAELKHTMHTAVVLSIILGVALSALGVAFSPVLLRLMQTPEELMPDATLYLRIYFTGLTGITVYNMGAAIITAMGDSKRPLYLLIFSCILSVAIKLLLVFAFETGIAGIAYATAVSQVVCALLVILLLCRQSPEQRLNLRQLRIVRHILKDIVRIGLPGGIQGMIVAGSNVVVQSYVNRLGALVVAGYSASSRADAFIMMPISGIALAASTFVGQNLGAGNVRRARDGVRVSMALGLAITAVLSVIVYVFARDILRVFTPDASVIEHGMDFMRVFVPCYFVLCFTQILPGALRGAGDVKFATMACVGSFVFLRQIYLFFATKILYNPVTVAIGYPATWTVAAILIAIYYIRSDWSGFGKRKINAAN